MSKGPSRSQSNECSREPIIVFECLTVILLAINEAALENALMWHSYIYILVQVDIDDLVAADLTSTNVIINKAHGTRYLRHAPIVDIELLTLLVVTLDIASHSICFLVNLVFITIVTCVISYIKPLLLMTVACVLHWYLLELSVAHVDLGWWLDSMRLLTILILRQRLLLVISLVDRDRHRLVWWRADTVIQLLWIGCMLLLIYCFLYLVGNVWAVLVFCVEGQLNLRRYILLQSILIVEITLNAIRLRNRDVLRDLHRWRERVLLDHRLNCERLVPHIPPTVETKIFWILFDATSLISSQNYEWVVPSRRRKVLKTTHLLRLLQLIPQVKIYWDLQIPWIGWTHYSLILLLLLQI